MEYSKAAESRYQMCIPSNGHGKFPFSLPTPDELTSMGTQNQLIIVSTKTAWSGKSILIVTEIV